MNTILKFELHLILWLSQQFRVNGNMGLAQRRLFTVWQQKKDTSNFDFPIFQKFQLNANHFFLAFSQASKGQGNLDH